MIKDKQSKTFYRDGVQMTTEDENIIDTLAAMLGFGPKYKPTVTPKYECPKCHKIVAYYKEIHPDTGMDEMVLYCQECKSNFPENEEDNVK